MPIGMLNIDDINNNMSSRIISINKAVKPRLPPSEPPPIPPLPLQSTKLTPSSLPPVITLASMNNINTPKIQGLVNNSIILKNIFLNLFSE